MPRRKAAPKREILPDPLFGSAMLAKFITVVMRRGKKSVAEHIVYGALQVMLERARKTEQQEESKKEESKKADTVKHVVDLRANVAQRQFALELFQKALENVQPAVEVKSRRVGGATYQIPVEVRPGRRMALAMRWIVEHANSRGEKTMVLRLAFEILEAIDGKGGAVKKREEVHRMANANKAFAHYRW